MESNPSTSVEPVRPTASGSANYWVWLAPLLLTLILAFGAGVRLIGVDWDSDQHLHPDERFLTEVESELSLPGEPATGEPPQGCDAWGGYFDTACSPLSPYNHNFGLFVYGTFPIFLTRVIGGWLDQTGYGQIFLVGRVLSALFDLSTVLLIFFIGRRMYGLRAGLLGALFLAASVLDIQQAHFFTVDTFTNVPILIAFWFAMDIADAGKKWTAFVWAGLAFGLALAGRINIAPFAAVLVAAGALRAYLAARESQRSYARGTESLEDTREVSAPELLDAPISGEPTGPAGGQALAWAGARAFVGLAAAALLALIVFRIAQPYAANGPNLISPTLPQFDLSRGLSTVAFDTVLSWAGGVNLKFADNMTYVSQLVAGKIDYPPGHQWTDRTPYVFPFENMVLWGLGLPMGLAAWAGFLLALYRLIRYREWQHLLIVVWVGITFGYSGQQFVKTMRYFLQIYPFLALLAGYFLVTLWDRAVDVGRGIRLGFLSPSAWAAAARIGAALVAVVVVGYTLFWALAFTTIYTRPVSRVDASRWIYANVPVGSVVGNEAWDDPLPLPIDGKNPFGGMYRGVSASQDGELHWYDEDTPDKRSQAIQWLDETDYVFLSSNRLYLSIPRLPMRYPMTTKYYQWLFDGTLGFDQVAVFTSRPQLFGIVIDDDNAEEAFTVYDHPKVLIFKKSARYSHDKTAALFNSIDLSEVYRLTPLQATQDKTALLLTPGDWTAQMQGGTWSQIFHPEDWVNQIPVVVWLGLIEILGWLAWPLAFVVFRALRDRGYVFAKGLGILLPAWLAWWFASIHLMPFSRRSIALAIALVVILAGLIAWKRGREMIAYLRQNKRIVLLEEVLFLAAFGAFLLIRYGNPDLWHPYFGGEKPLDFTILNEIVKSTWFPPYDAWFAGGYLNYYYFGQMIAATLVRFTGIVTEVAYNLALPMFFGLTAAGAFSVAFNLVAGISQGSRPRLGPGTDAEAGAAVASRGSGTESPMGGHPHAPASAGPLPSHEENGVLSGGTEGSGEHPGITRAVIGGLAAAIFVAVIGNLGQVLLIGQTLVKIGGGDPAGPLTADLLSAAAGIERVLFEHVPFDVPIGWWYWNASRVIPDTINEFPFFTFLYADLHAHLMALPFTLVVLGLAANFAIRAWEDDGRLPGLRTLPISPVDVIEIAVAALVLGALRAINYADFATYQLVIAAALAIGAYGRRRRIDLQSVLDFGWRLVAIYLLATLLWQPFVSHFATAYLNVELWSGARTSPDQYLVVHGIFLFVIATFVLWQTFDTKNARGPFRFLRMAIKRSARLDRMLWLQRIYAAPPTAFEDLAAGILLIGMVLEGVMLVMQLFTFALVWPLLVLAGLLVLRPDLDPGRRLVALLIAAGLALTLVVEVVVYNGDIGRMNTVFKFYVQVWIFFAIAAAVGLASMIQLTEPSIAASPAVPAPAPPRSSLPSWWWAVFGILVFGGLLYPATAAPAKVKDRFVPGSPPGLNGMDYMKTAVYQDGDHAYVLEYDREAIEWLRSNVQGSPVLLEGNSPLYRWGTRIAINTGLPTVIGWDWHEKQQRSVIDPAIIDHRIQAVASIYNTTDVNAALDLLHNYHVRYVYVGDLERAYYDAHGLSKFDLMVSSGFAQVVYQNARVKIYELEN